MVEADTGEKEINKEISPSHVPNKTLAL